MKKITYFLLFLATVAHAGLFDKDLKVRIYPVCSLKNYVINWNFTVEKNSVIQKQEVYDNKVLLQSDLKRLENCLVVDKANWKCGGNEKISYGTLYKDKTYQVINGKFTFSEYKNGVAQSDAVCKIEQLN
jgi:hypothetical protein